jgi:hypothetical protein
MWLPTLRRLAAVRLSTVRLPAVRCLAALGVSGMRLATLRRLADLRLPGVRCLSALGLSTVWCLAAAWFSAVRLATLWRPPTRRHRRLPPHRLARWHPARVLRRHPSLLLVRWLTAARGRRALWCRAARARTWAARMCRPTAAGRHSGRWRWRESALGRALLRRWSLLERRRPPISRERLVRASGEAGRSDVVLGAAAGLTSRFRDGSRWGHAVAAVRRCPRRTRRPAVRRDRCRCRTTR